MKKVIVVFAMLLLSLSSIKAAEFLGTLLPNGDFEGGTNVQNGKEIPEHWGNWGNFLDGWGPPSSTDFDEEDGNGFVICTVDATGTAGGGYSVIFQDNPRLDLDTWGIPAGTTVTLNAFIKDMAEGGSSDGAALKLESYANGTTMNADLEVAIPGITSKWEYYSMEYTIPEGADALTSVVVATTGWGGANPKISKFAFDNVGIGLPGGVTPALMPEPTLGEGYSSDYTTISWTNPEPNNPTNVISAQAYLLESDVPISDPNMGPEVYDEGVQVLIVAPSQESATVSLNPNKYYYWKVDVTNETTGTVVPGFVWNFQTMDAPPINISAGVDQYVWLEDGSTQFTLTATYNDDDKSEVAVLWEDISNPLEQAPGTTVTINNPASAETTVDVDGDGWYLFKLTVSDAVGSGTDQSNVGVYVNACEAAKADPTDIGASYPAGHGDIDGDCDTDLVDFALLAGSWLECMSEKLGCN